MVNNILEKKRLSEFDIAKGIAILCVILGHLGIRQINRVVFVFHMPLFFLISGYFLSENDSFANFAKKKFKQLMVPYIVACLIICCLSIPVSIAFGQDIGHNLFKWICGSIYGSGTRSGIIPGFPSFIGAIWFLEALFLGCLITRYVIDNWSDRIVPVVVLVISYVGYATAFKLWLPFNIQSGCTATGFIFLGYLFKKHSITKLPPMILLSMLLITAWCIKYFNGFWLVQSFFGNGWMDVIGALTTTYLILLFSKYIISKITLVSDVLQWYGRNSLIILFFHYIEVHLFPRVKVLKCLEKLGLTPVTAVLLLILLKILWATLGVMAVDHIPMLKKIFTKQ